MNNKVWEFVGNALAFAGTVGPLILIAEHAPPLNNPIWVAVAAVVGSFVASVYVISGYSQYLLEEHIRPMFGDTIRKVEALEKKLSSLPIQVSDTIGTEILDQH